MSMDRRRTPRGLLRALRVVESLPRPDTLRGVATHSDGFSRGYSAGLWDARAAIMREIAHSAPKEAP